MRYVWGDGGTSSYIFSRWFLTEIMYKDKKGRLNMVPREKIVHNLGKKKSEMARRKCKIYILIEAKVDKDRVSKKRGVFWKDRGIITGLKTCLDFSLDAFF